MKSIMQQKDGSCYLCMKLKMDYSTKQDLEEHHVIFNAHQRNLSEKYGLKVYLCRYHHTESAEAVHKNRSNRSLLEDAAQRAFEDRFPELDFMAIFGKNYKIARKESKKVNDVNGFRLIEEKGE